MPCSTCEFNVGKQDAGYCSLRELWIVQAATAGCVNHSYANLSSVRTPVGPVFDVDHAIDVAENHHRFIRPQPPTTYEQISASPDSAEIRESLLEMLAEIPQNAIVYEAKILTDSNYDRGQDFEWMLCFQLGELREKRAVEGLERILRFDPDGEPPNVRLERWSRVIDRESRDPNWYWDPIGWGWRDNTPPFDQLFGPRAILMGAALVALAKIQGNEAIEILERAHREHVAPAIHDGVVDALVHCTGPRAHALLEKIEAGDDYLRAKKAHFIREPLPPGSADDDLRADVLWTLDWHQTALEEERLAREANAKKEQGAASVSCPCGATGYEQTVYTPLPIRVSWCHTCAAELTMIGATYGIYGKQQAFFEGIIMARRKREG